MLKLLIAVVKIFHPNLIEHRRLKILDELKPIFKQTKYTHAHMKNFKFQLNLSEKPLDDLIKFDRLAQSRKSTGSSTPVASLEPSTDSGLTR
jgi:hypothetical protein